MLSNGAIKQLDQLATKHELKRAQVIELLITKEANQTKIKKDSSYDGWLKGSRTRPYQT